ncbi:DUF2237 family protein [Algoriphagus sp. AK58]|uniref:DUF2237 family protein n=1 Tax=Algoriphagus sp. AK58 TaxID=1406877 RepID=UPI00164F4628|nr:DUF2237 domain-containing protein [Algoriphagus sp. AK58]MBC6366054.1 DUF2237 domain-containing protein [Algoriphagus sp. AK58]
MDKNVFGEPLIPCSLNPITGFFRTGCCETGALDFGTHTVCAVVTSEFLEFSKSRGNYLITPRPEYEFPGLNPGDKWCLCVLRWLEAFREGVAPLVVLEATHERTLEFVSIKDLISKAWRG